MNPYKQRALVKMRTLTKQYKLLRWSRRMRCGIILVLLFLVVMGACLTKPTPENRMVHPMARDKMRRSQRRGRPKSPTARRVLPDDHGGAYPMPPPDPKTTPAPKPYNVSDRLAEDPYWTVHEYPSQREGTCIKEQQGQCTVKLNSRWIQVVDWLHRALATRKCGRVDLPKSCRLADTDLRCSVPLFGAITPYLRMFHLLKIKYNLVLADRGPFGLYIDINMSHEEAASLIETFDEVGVDQLAADLTTYEVNLIRKYREYYVNMSRDVEFHKGYNGHPAEFLQKLIARLDYHIVKPEEELFLGLVPDLDDSVTPPPSADAANGDAEDSRAADADDEDEGEVEIGETFV